MDRRRLVNMFLIGLVSLFMAIGAFFGFARSADPQSSTASRNAAIPAEQPPVLAAIPWKRALRTATSGPSTAAELTVRAALTAPTLRSIPFWSSIPPASS